MYLCCLPILLLQLLSSNLAGTADDMNIYTLSDGDLGFNTKEDVKVENDRVTDGGDAEEEEDNKQERIGEGLNNIEGGHSEEEDEKPIEERISKRLDELGISQDDISSLPVVARLNQMLSSIVLIFRIFPTFAEYIKILQGNP